MNILVTGAKGFIGQSLTKDLSNNHTVYALARSFEKNSTSKNLIHIEHDFNKPLDSNRLPEKIDAVIHLAQSSQYRNFPEGMRDMVAVNLLGLTEVLDYAKAADCDYFINFSSGSVYDPSNPDQSETANLNPKAAYPLTKFMSEKLVDLYQGFFKTLNVRLFFPYGPGQEGMLIPNLINSVKQGNPIGLQGNQGGLELCPIYISDVVSICTTLLGAQTIGVLNVGGNEQLRLETIGNEIGAAIGKPASFNVDVAATPALFRPSLDRMQKLLAEHEFVSFKEGINRVVSD